MTQHAAQPYGESTPEPPKTPWYKKRWVLMAGVFLLGILLGSAGGSADPTTSPEYKAQAADLQEAEDELEETQAELDKTQADLETIAGDVPAREEAVEQAEAEMKEREAALKKAEAAVAQREKKVGVVEAAIAANTIPGDGVYRVGADMKPGTYRSVDNVDCYWMISSDANGSNIIQNNIVTGPALTTVSAGTYFTTTRCGDWVLQQ